MRHVLATKIRWKRLNPKTRSSYRSVLMLFEKFLLSRGRDPDSFSTSDVDDFIAVMRARRLVKDTLRGQRSIVTNWFALGEWRRRE